MLNINCLSTWNTWFILGGFLALSILYQDGVCPRITSQYLGFQFMYMLEAVEKPFLGSLCEQSVPIWLILVLVIAGLVLVLEAHTRKKKNGDLDNRWVFFSYIGLLLITLGVLLQSRSILLLMLAIVIFMACFDEIRSERV